MGNYEDIRNLIHELSGQQNLVSIPVVYIEITGDLNTALLLNQMVFWSDKSKRKDGYFYKSYKDWEDEIHLSEYQVRRSIKKLKELDFIETELKRANGSPTLHFKVKIDLVSEWILKKLKNRNLRNLSIDTEETKETITYDYTDDYNINDSDSVGAVNQLNTLRTQATEIYESYIPNRKSEKTKTIKRIEALIKKYGDDKVIRAVNRYKEETKETETKYIKMSIGFFNEDYIARFLEDNYSIPTAESEPQRKYKVLS